MFDLLNHKNHNDLLQDCPLFIWVKTIAKCVPKTMMLHQITHKTFMHIHSKSVDICLKYVHCKPLFLLEYWQKTACQTTAMTNLFLFYASEEIRRDWNEWVSLQIPRVNIILCCKYDPIPAVNEEQVF